MRDATLQSVRERVGVVSQDAHLFHDTLRANLLYAKPDATDDELVDGAARRAGLGPDRARCPTGSTRWSGTVATACPAARSNAWRSPACC